MSKLVSFFLLAGWLLCGPAVWAHTTILIPQAGKNGRQVIKVLHFHPVTGAGLMGIRLGVEDRRDLKGLAAIYLVHEGEEKKLDAIAVPDYYTVRGERRATYSIPVDKKSGFFRPGDYIIVVKHRPHWKENEGLYRQKVAKYYLNLHGLMTDWPRRVLKKMPEIIPLVPPFNVTAGSLFRAEAVNENGRPLPHARINIEYLNYPLGATALAATAAPFLPAELADTIVFTDSAGGFAFVPPRKGLWTLTLVDGDQQQTIGGRELQFDSSLSIMVK
ncbi:MAG: DUF4198 domain-containing protein [Deltaproteobacteria bacterium]|nr:DUF4198 domain-containing protein [Deltaproteobacteria bacterium]